MDNAIRHTHVDIHSEENPHNLPKARKRLHGVRGAFFAVLEENYEYLKEEEAKEKIQSARKKIKKLHQKEDDFTRIESSKLVKDILKQTSKDVLDISGIDYNDASRQALHTLAVRYKKMGTEKFLTRFENGKIERDIRFIIYVLHFYGQQGYEGIKESLKIAKEGAHHHTTLRHGSPAMEALSSLFTRVEELRDERGGEVTKEHTKMLYEYGKEIASRYKKPKAKKKK